MTRFVRQVRRWPVVIAIVIVVAGGSTAAWAMTRSSSSSGATQLVTATRTTVKNTVSASGTIEPAHQADLDFAVSGRVTRIYVKVGDSVQKGDPLAKVSATSLKATEAAAAATVSADQDKLSEATSGSAAYTADEAVLSADQQSLANAKTAVKDAILRATIKGTVTAVNLTKGQSVSSASGGSASSDSGSSAQVELQSAKSFLVNATVDDTEVSQVKKGQTASVTPEGATFPVSATVSSVSKVSSSSSGVVSFPVVVKIASGSTGVYAGASATVAITTENVPDVLEIPTLAITYSGSKATVQVSNGGHTTTRTITTGQSYGLETQVLSGISAGEKVVVRTPTFARLGTNRNGGGEGGRGLFGNFGGNGGSTTTGGNGGFPTGSFGSSGGGFPTGGFGNAGGG